jgi:hypothetical protein
MSYSVIPTRVFLKKSKKLAKKYASLKIELMELFEELSENPYLGTSLGDNRFKIRVAVESKGKGKSGGVRVITYLINENNEIYTVDIYDKSERDSISDKELNSLIKKLKEELNS